ncbi:MAG TPA: CRTAC1 family protein [Cyclobacteriaceae bacterium]|nr:CRTAC1 family protein [Cyclobacteriaceae bacterium]
MRYLLKTKIFVFRNILPCLALLALGTCEKYRCHEEMLSLLREVTRNVAVADNSFSPSSKLIFMDSLLSIEHSTPGQIAYCKYLKANILLELGREGEATTLFEELTANANQTQLSMIHRDLGISYLRQGERSNCIAGHSAASCVLPIKGLGIHQDFTGSRKAIDTYTDMVTANPNDIESMWLLNLAYMTLGEYPQNVPKSMLIPDMGGDTIVKVKAFNDIAGGLGIDVNNMAGGSVVDDFDNDGYLDIITSSMDLMETMHYFHNNADGTFSELSDQSGMVKITGGLNMVQADYDNDGDRDILVLRGAWKGKYGDEPNSLLENNGDGTFTDVTTISGLLSFHPTQTASWNDFNNDGWLDIIIGNESGINQEDKTHESELYLNNADGTFTEVAVKCGIDVKLFVKGVTSGDYDNDGWQDIFMSTMSGRRLLYKNMGVHNGFPVFTNVTSEAHLEREVNRTFTTWFFDYDNDGWLDIFACDYTFQKSLSFYAAAEKLGREEGSPDKILLYHNNHDGTFTSVAKELGLNKVTFSMGGNFGDIDNDGYLDMYLGTGNPQYQSLVPNKMYKNMGGKAFADVTNSARVGHLQKGHGVSFADLDNDGDQDIHIEMGGAFAGDAYPNSFFLNPGQNDNNWIAISLEGKDSNRDGIGARIKVTIIEDGLRRTIFRDLNSGGSFGASPLRREIGLGKATRIEDLEIIWPGTNVIQRFKYLKPNQFIKIREGSTTVEQIPLKKIEWRVIDPLCLPY